MRISQDIVAFQQNWCRMQRARIDLNSLLKPCNYNISWNGESPNRLLQTDASQSFISLFDIRPAGQFSRFSIQTKTQNGELKLIGGDSWRVLLRGPTTLSPTVFDHGNGTYEFLVLIMDPGVYKLDITLDYSLCDGYRDPPKNWFIVGEQLSNRYGRLRIRKNLKKICYRERLFIVCIATLMLTNIIYRNKVTKWGERIST